MKSSKWSILGYIIGIVYTAITLVRYTIVLPDSSNITIISNLAIGLLICSVAYLYNERLQQGNILLAIEDYLADNKLK